MTTPTATRDPVDYSPRRTSRGRHRWLVEHRPFLVALALGATMRLVVLLAFTPSLMISDGPTYLHFLDTFEPTADRPFGYGLVLLYPLSHVTDTLLAVVVAQHLMGLAIAGLLYILLRRWGVGRWLATLAALPVLFDSLELILEHAPLSDTLFVLVVTIAVVVLGWRRSPTPASVLAAGLLLGVSVTVREVGIPLVLAGAAYCLVVGQGWRGRLVGAAALSLGFALPVAAYATWYHAELGDYALSESGGRSAYMRTTSFVECAGLPVLDYQRVLCPPEPRGQRLDPTNYGWLDDRTLPQLVPPPGTSKDEAMRQFAGVAIGEQPLDYAAVVVRDFALNFDPTRGNRFEFNTAWKWKFSSYLDIEPTIWTRLAYQENGGQQLSVHQPYASALASYQMFGYLPGPLLLGCLVLGVLGGLGIGRARRSPLRPLCLLLTVAGLGLMLVPDLTTQFVWRYQLPALVLLPAAAALAVTAWRGGQPGAATVATPSTD